MKINIEQILQSERAWEYVLLDIVDSEELDPWDIDITKLTSNYMKRIRKMKSLDLRIPARLILAAAILLKMQSEQLIMTEEDDELFEELFYDEENDSEFEESQDDLSLLDLRVRRKPVRKVTLSDLVSNLQKALETKEKEPAPYESEEFEPKLEEADISKKIDELHKKILKTNLNKIPFSDLLKDKSRDEVIGTLLPLLHLANNQKIELEQKGFFQEFFIIPRKQNT